MRISDCEWIPATRHQTWEALTDPTVLQQCIPGCVQITQASPTEYHVALHTSVGGIKAAYEGEILLSDVNAPDSCTFAFEGKGAAAGLVIGTAQVNLSDKEQGTRLSYTVAAMAGGQLAALGDKVITGAAEKIITKFMAAFTEHMVGQPRTVYTPPQPAADNSIPARHPLLTWAIPLAILASLMGYHTFFR